MNTPAVIDVIAERDRQRDGEGWTPEQDDQSEHGQLAVAGASYALSGSGDHPVLAHAIWPWGPEWWKPKDRRRDLVRAAALILAEIERLDRAAGVRS